MALKRKIAYIDLTSGDIDIKPIPLEMREKFLGGRGLDAYLVYNHVPRGADPLGPQNVSVISAGILGATCASASARTHVAAKSPLTGYFGSCNMGGFFAPELRWAGFDHLVIKGKAAKPVYLWISNGAIEIRDAAGLWGLGSFEAQEEIRRMHDDDEVQSLVIGPAGENMVRYANVMTSLKNAGGRSGMGAVLGSKNLKAVAARGTMDVEIAYPKEALAYDKQIIDGIVSTKLTKIMGSMGTMFIYGVTNSTGLVRVKNFQENQLPDSESIECENIEDVSIGTSGCFGCQIHCRHRYVIKEGEYAGTLAEGPEYTSQGAFGAELGCRDFNTILVGNHLVNHYGIDTLEVGSMMAWAFECYEKGMITDEDTGGMKLEWGNHAIVPRLIGMISAREGIGDILAEGPLRAAKKIGKGSEKLLIQVKGMSNLHSDERPTPALALGIATGTRGSDHLRSRPAIDLYHLPEPVLRKVYGQPTPYDGPLSSDYGSYEGKPRMVQWQEMVYMAVDCLGVCKYHTVFLSPNHLNFNEFSKLLKLNTGLDFSPLDVWTVAERAYNIERLFNIREGATKDDDWLSDRYFDEPTPMGLDVARGKTLDREKFAAMRAEYYELHGWDEGGVPTRQTLERLGIADEPTHVL
ncbi:MAG: aldehyde ferredoxin oxidoreductase family protein [Pseudomonadota bacterium]